MGRIFWKFFFAFLLALLIAGLAVGSAMWLRQKQFNQQVANSPMQIGRLAAWQVSDAAEIAQYGGRQALIDYLEDQRISENPEVYAITSDNLDLLDRSWPSHQIRSARQLLTESPELKSIREISLADGESILLLIPQTGGQPLEAYASLYPKKQPIILLLITGVLSGLLFSALLAWWFTQPIRHLRRAFAAVATGDLSVRVSQNMGQRKDELAELGYNFDAMTEKLDLLVSAQRNLLHDVSHELRSPLARMQAAIGIAEQKPDKAVEVLARLERESERIDLLIGDLLNLSRLDSLAADNAAQTNFDLTTLLYDLLEDGRYEAEEKQIEIQAKIDADLRLTGKPTLMQRAVENILRNAIKFTPENGHITLHARKVGTFIEIDISDTGPGVSQAELPKLFQPFFRGSDSKNQHYQHSSGLGLTIAERAVKAHHGTISADINAVGGLQVMLRFPQKPALLP